MGSESSRRHPEELKQRAVQMVADLRSDTVSQWQAMGRVADLLGVGTAKTVRKWVRQAEIHAGSRAGQTSEESEVLRRLRRENAELKRGNAILKVASAFFAAELDRPSQYSWGSSAPTSISGWALMVSSGVLSRCAPCSASSVSRSPRRRITPSSRLYSIYTFGNGGPMLLRNKLIAVPR